MQQKYNVYDKAEQISQAGPRAHSEIGGRVSLMIYEMNERALGFKLAGDYCKRDRQLVSGCDLLPRLAT